ncbi:GlsB/YeaQ/YmgE family stress response membrane protein [Burkholderia pyrrocinia]|uniref:GlsB/YeaQ/YmgE family stress response membrane protein n=1 Tax=Burkholderia pyrrocinia TaxID=60550 RepID=UPI00158CF80B|nr:GlsB/YeaQ/YmgE family stress response membrane protein [Burkholderia pyrrocinia]
MEQNLIAWLVIGVVAGLLVDVLFTGSGFGVIVDIVAGGAGALIGGASLLLIPLGEDRISSNIIAAVSAVVIVLIVRIVRRILFVSSHGKGTGDAE